ncbi:MAG TPA: histidine kinase [Daejeonella sp.]|nr:histidine kinase [Daejeonella sp.]
MSQEQTATSLHTKQYGVNKHVLFILTGLGFNALLIFIVLSIKAEVTFENLLGITYADIILSSVLSVSFLYLCDFAINRFNHWFSHRPNSALRYMLEMISVLLVGFCLIHFFTSLYISVFVPGVGETQEFIDDVNRSKMILLDFLLIIYACMRGFHFFSFLKDKELEKIQWQKDISHSNFEALKNQLNPHFLFNSFSVLISLIHADPYKAEDFIGKLSKAYRYLLEQRDKEIIPLFTELEFLKNFEFILAQRFANKIKIQFPEFSQETAGVIPYTIILIVEHLIASNKMSAARPLNVCISLQPQMLKITHSYLPKTNLKVSGQLLLLQERYEQLSGRQVQIANAGFEQTISIPLLKVS